MWAEINGNELYIRAELKGSKEIQKNLIRNEL